MKRTKFNEFICNLSTAKGNHRTLFYICCIILLYIIIITTLNITTTINFNPMNGSFQNYNPVRRLLEGQLVFIDFYDYLGLGHLYLGSLITYLLGGNFGSSLIAFNFLSLIRFILIIYILGYAILNNKTITIIVTLILTVFSIQLLKDIVFVGNSARLIRGTIIPLVCIAWFANNYFVNNISFAKKFYIYFQIFYWSLISAISFFWSNDYGISAWFSIISLICFIGKLKFRKLKNAIIVGIITLVLSLFIIFTFVYLLTDGEILLWFNLITDNGAFQAWYYNSNKSYFIWDIDLSKGMVIQYFICIAYVLKLSSTKSYSMGRYIVPLFANFASVCAANEYKLFSGNYAHEVSYSILCATVTFEIINYLLNTLKPKFVSKIIPVLVTATIILSLSSIINLTIRYYKLSEQSIEGAYFKNLGGYMTNLNNDIINAAKFLKNSKFFATYASAQEVVSNTFQPSGTDYIIHVLGNNARRNYLSSFKTDNFNYAATIKESFNEWEYWVKRANWFFYRELYSNWHPIYANSYEVYWAKNNKGFNSSYYIGNFQPYIEKIDEQNMKIIINLDKKISGTADVYIDYFIDNNTNFKSKIATPFIINKLAEIKNTGFNFAENKELDRNYLPEIGKEFIPITVVNGYGEVTISSHPKDYTKLIINKIFCNKIFNVEFNYIEISKIKNINNNALIFVQNSVKNRYILNGARQINISDKIYNIENIKQSSDYYIINISEPKLKITQLSNVLDTNNYALIIHR